MPRRTVTRCSPRATALTIDPVSEFILGHGHLFTMEPDGFDAPTLRRAWAKHGEAITERWVDAYPGSRPAWAYLAGDIEPIPTPRGHVKAEGDDLHLRLHREGQVPYLYTGGHMFEPELRHLQQLGLVDDTEAGRALKRLDCRDGTSVHRYTRLSAGQVI